MITSTAAAWAIVLFAGSCAPSTDPNHMCEGRLVSGLVWGTQQECSEELHNNPLPGAVCREIVSVLDPDVTDDGPDGMEDVLRTMEDKAGVQHL